MLPENSSYKALCYKVSRIKILHNLGKKTEAWSMFCFRDVYEYFTHRWPCVIEILNELHVALYNETKPIHYECVIVSCVCVQRCWHILYFKMKIKISTNYFVVCNCLYH